jgi:histidinol-phosphate aminotransferase
MTFDPELMLRTNIRMLKPYRSARDDYKSGMLLDANENPYDPEIRQARSLNRYPDPHYTELREKLAALKGVKPDQVFLGNGSDEAIDLVIRMFCEPGRDRILITPPTYGMYKVCADINGVETLSSPLRPDFSLPVKQVLEDASGARVIFLCSPNNPSGNALSKDDIRTVLRQFPGLVVVDEAYIDFSSDEGMLPLLNENPNLIVLQTLSKAWGLAGIRLGMAFSSAKINGYMMRVKPPYNVNALTQSAALEALSDPGRMRSQRDAILAERGRLSRALSSMKGVIAVEPSDANFLLTRIESAESVYRRLAGRGVIVRYRGDQKHCENGLRITIGTPEENDRLLDALKEILPEPKARNR